MLSTVLEKLDARQLRLIAAGGFALLAAALFSYGVLPGLKAYRSAGAEAARLELALNGQPDLDGRLADLEAEVAVLDKTLHGDTANLPENQLEAFVVGRLQSISWRNGVDLVSVEPGDGEIIQAFAESLFEVELSGDYFDLFTWLGDVGDELGFVVIKEYGMRPVDEGAADPRLAVRLTMATYRAAQI